MTNDPRLKTAMEADVERVVRYIFGNGQPGLDERLAKRFDDLEKYIDARDEHKQKNAEQDTAAKFAATEKKHDDNFAALFAFMNKAIGSITTAKVIGGFIAVVCTLILTLLLWILSPMRPRQALVSSGHAVVANLNQDARMQ